MLLSSRRGKGDGVNLIVGFEDLAWEGKDSLIDINNKNYFGLTQIYEMTD